MLEALFITGVDDITVSGLTQWDRGQMVQITCPDLPELFEVHFANRKSKKALVTTATATGGVATITLPDELLREPYELITWLYYTSATDGETVKTIRFPVERRKKPEDYIVDLPQSQKTDAEKLIEKKLSDYVEQELGAATMAQESATNAALSASAAEASANRAEAFVSNGPTIGENGNWWVYNTATEQYEDTGVYSGGSAPYIGANGNWFVGLEDTGVSATGDDGEDGITPHIGTNGNWWVGETDTGIEATAGAEAAQAAAAEAAASADKAGTSEANAAKSETQASAYVSEALFQANDARNARLNAQRYAESAGSFMDRANGYAEESKTSATSAASSALSAESAKTAAENAASHQPTLGENNTWMVWDATLGAYVDTGVSGVGPSGEDGKDYILTDADKAEIAETVKADVPLVKTAEQPTFVSSIEEMTDTSKVYVLSKDGYFYKYTEGNTLVEKLTADDFAQADMSVNGLPNDTGYGGLSRLYTKDILPLDGCKIAVSSPSAYYGFIVYFYNTDTPTETGVGTLSENLTGKTTWLDGNVTDITTVTCSTGTLEGATHCRIAFRHNTSAADITNYIDALVDSEPVVITYSDAETWTNTGLAYNQPADYEDRIVALEKAFGGIVNGTY